MTSARGLQDVLRNAFDFLLEAELLLYARSVALGTTRVTWHAKVPGVPFLLESGPATSEQYLRWVIAGHYSAVLPDGSLLQLTYDVHRGEVSGHRLAYIPCPVLLDEELLRDGAPIADVVGLYLESLDPGTHAQRSPIRFDFDPAAGGEGHPAAHLSLNDHACRIACVAPMHPYRFLDFIYRHFYPALRAAQPGWFAAAAHRMLGKMVLSPDDRKAPHISWDLHPRLHEASTRP